MYILGISAYYHDSAAALIFNGEVIAAAQEERFTRKKHDHSFPHNSVKYCLREANISIEQISNIVFYEKPFLKFERLIETYLAFAPRGFKNFAASMPIWIKEKLYQKNTLLKELSLCFKNSSDLKEKLLFSEHHLSHASSAFYPSPFKNAAILTIDGVGEWSTASVAVGSGKNLRVIKEIKFPHSLGLLYSAFTYYLGFKVNSGEYKLMGLAPYGIPEFANIIKSKLIKIADDGSFKLDMNYFNYATGLKMTNRKFHNLFGAPPRKAETSLTQREMNLAASIQLVTEEIIIKIIKNIRQETSEINLCLAGGVSLNCVVNGIILKEKIFHKVWVQPASGDAGGALGAALSVWHLHYKKSRNLSQKKDSMKGSYLGPKYSDDEIEFELKSNKAKFLKLTEDEMIDKVVDNLLNEKAIGWMQGRMEFGPRALGNRSIIADPRSKNMQKTLNLKVKYRESFRPFAPSILNEKVNEWFDLTVDSPYMMFVSDVKESKRLTISTEDQNLFGIDKLNLPHSIVPAITHVDYSARVQTVHKDTNPVYYKLISKFNERTSCPILVNTSFNIRGEPIVCSPKDAFNCFMGTDLDILVIGNYFLLKEEQDKNLNSSYRQFYELD